MPLKQIPDRSTDEATWRKRVAENINGVLKFDHDESRIQTKAEVEAGVTPLNPAYRPSAYIDIRRYGASTDASGSENLDAINKASLVAFQNGGTVMIPEGTWEVDGTVIMRDGVKFCGTGPEASILSFVGTNTYGFLPENPGTRSYDQGIRDLTIRDDGTGTTGLALDSVSTSEFINVIITGWTYGVNVYSPTDGYSVYNRFHHVTANGCTTGFILNGTGSNATIFVGCRYNGASATGTRAFEVENANGCQWFGTHIDIVQDAWVFTSPAGAGYADANVIMGSRVEGTTNVYNLGTNVRYTQIGWNFYQNITGNLYVDNGTRNNIDDPPNLWRKDFAGVPSANGDVRFLRSVDGSDKPFVVLRDAVNASTPITLQLENERASGGVYIKGTTGGTEKFSVDTAGKGNLQNLVLKAAAPTVSANQIGFGNVAQTTVGAAGAAAALPATPSFYVGINIAGTDYVIPAYLRS